MYGIIVVFNSDVVLLMLLCELINMRALVCVCKPVDRIYIVHVTNASYIVGILAVRFDTGY